MDGSRVVFAPFETRRLFDLLQIKQSPFRFDVIYENSHLPLTKVMEHLEALGCQSFIYEGHYIDRDFMEDYSSFYSRHFQPVVNYCQRLSFFVLKQDDLIEVFSEAGSGSSESEFMLREAYLGFSVIKPLPGCPVGRTVLKPPSGSPGNNAEFATSFPVESHIMGITFASYGLPYQQQDSGVGACATSAIWTCLQKIQHLEHSVRTAPAEITEHASRFSLPHGKAMPSEGLGIDQMCLGIKAAGAEPNLYTDLNPESVREYLASAVRSGLPSILILRAPDGAKAHAVAVAGIKRGGSTENRAQGLVDKSHAVTEVYVHDDRIGPYQLASLGSRKASESKIIRTVLKMLKLSDQESFVKDSDQETIPKNSEQEVTLTIPEDPVEWTVTHILIPLHDKIRITFSGSYRILNNVKRVLISMIEAEFGEKSRIHGQYEIRICLAHEYLEEVRYAENTKIDLSAIGLARYIACLRFMLKEPSIMFDLIIDTTSTLRNLNVIGIVVHGKIDTRSRRILENIGGWLGARVWPA